MANATGLRMGVEHLTDEQVKYELGVRSLYVSRDNKTLRREKLQTKLYAEYQVGTENRFASYLAFDVDYEEVEQGFQTIGILLENDNRFNRDQIQHLETQVCHLADRINRMVPTDKKLEWENNKTKVLEWVNRIVEYYKQEPTHQIGKSSESSDGDDKSVSEQDEPNISRKTKPPRPSMRRIPVDPELLNSGYSNRFDQRSKNVSRRNLHRPQFRVYSQHTSPSSSHYENQYEREWYSARPKTTI